MHQSVRTLYDWDNQINKDFYEHLSIGDFKKFSHSSKLTATTDTEQIKNYILSARSILEVNAGFGRVVDGILSLGYRGQITAIERISSYCAYLQDYYREFATIINDDILSHQFTQRYDLVTLMWTSIAEFNPREQKRLIAKLARLVTKKGHIAIDVIDRGSELSHSSSLQDNVIHVNHGDSEQIFYIPADSELYNWCHLAGLKVCEVIRYQLDEKINRKCFMLALDR